MLNIVLFGPPGAGKGTQSEKLIAKYNLVHISTGDLLRAERANKTELGLAAQKLIDQGQLVPDDIVIGMVHNKLSDNAGAPGFIFDGFPRTVAQAEALDDILHVLGTSITLMIELDVDNDELIRRLVHRGETSGRTDDNEETALKRIEVYDRETKPVADFYKSQDKYFIVDGFGGIDEIFNRLISVINREFSMNMN
jgi:adenylate kinase